MHSIRETCGVYDLWSNSILLHEFFKSATAVDQALVNAERVEGEVSDFAKV
jgi:hypothetical protein